MFDWSDEAVGELRRLFDLCYPASRISADMAGTFGRRPTRNAVIGKLYRLGLSWHDRAKPKTPQPMRPKRKIVHRVANTWRPSKPMPQPSEPTVKALTEVGVRHCCTIWDLTNETCRWPLGDGVPEFYCGTPEANLHDGRPYCHEHARLAYHPSAAARRPFIPMGSSA